MTVGIDFVRVAHLPCPRARSIVVATSPPLGWYNLRLLGVESIAVFVLLAADLSSALRGIYLEDCVVWSIDVGVNSEAEQMLVVVCVDTRVDFSSPAVGVLTRVHGVCV